MTADAYVFVTSPTVGGDLDLTRLRGYALADAHTRLRRARGEDVLFTLALEDLWTGADRQGADEWAAALRRRLDELGISLDWDRSLTTSDPGVYRWSQWLFVKLVESGLAYRRGRGWYLRNTDLNAENHRRLDELAGWDEPVREAQRGLLHRVDGFDFDATALDGTTLSVFTGHPDSVSDAEFVGLSARRPELEAWLGDPELRRKVEDFRARDWNGTPIEEMPVVEVGMSVQVPSVAQPLPILVSPAVDARFGPAAILGIPNADPVDKALAKRLPKAGGLAWKVESKPPKTTPAVRYLTDDMPLTSSQADGAPAPIVHCDASGAVALPVEQLPLEPSVRGGSDSTECPRCGGAAKRDAGTIHPRLTSSWLELALAVAPDSRAQAMFESSELPRRLPTTRTVLDHGANGALLDMRTVAKALRDLGPLAFLADGEPHGPTTLHGAFALDGVTVDEAIAAHGADALRFALLHAASPAKPFNGGADALRHAGAFLAELRSFAQPRLQGIAGQQIDADDGLRRRLASWCDTAVARVTENIERLELHRATRNVIELLARIQDFEARVVKHRGEVTGLDRDASSAVTATLVRLLAPLAPALAEELWRGGGLEPSVHTAEWPRPQRLATAA